MKTVPATNQIRIAFLVVIVGLVTAGCRDIFFPTDPSNDPESNFEVFWQDYDRYYSFFELKHLNWDSMYRAKRTLITPTTNNKQLFDIFNDMIQYLADGHADLNAGSIGRAGFDFTKKAPVNKLVSVATYVALKVKSKTLSYGTIRNDIGYIAVKSFAGSQADFDGIDNILSEFKAASLKGVIVDIRGNGGGSDLYSWHIAKRFADQERVYSYYRYRSGPGHNDFGTWGAKTIKPEGEHFDGRVMLLTNRQVFSSAEDFVLAMKAFPTVTIVGDTTGGGSGNPMLRTLPNGWTYRVPRWQQVDADMNYYEGVGLLPDIAIWITPDDTKNGKDTILERAIEELQK